MGITARGAGLLGTAPVLLGAGFAFGYPELTVIGTTAGVALLFAVGYVAWRPRLAVRRDTDPDRVMRGESSRTTLTVSNASRLRAATLVAHDRCGPAQIPVPLLRLRAGRDTTVCYPVPTTRRGVVRIGPLRVVRRDPLALFTLARGYGGVETVRVYPRVYPLTAVPPGIARSLDGLIDRVPHGTITFDTLREYVIGDELRRVHWRTTARIGQLMVREHLDTSLPRLVVLLDDRAAAYRGPGREPWSGTGEVAAFEAACEAAASILVAAVRAELPITLTLVSGTTVSATGRGTDTRPFLDLLAEVTLDAGGPPAGGSAPTGSRAPLEATRSRAPLEATGSRAPLEAATSRLRHRRLGDTLIVLTGPGNADDLGQLGTLRGAYPTIVVVTLGAAAPIPTTMEGVVVVAAADGADFAAAWDGTSTW